MRLLLIIITSFLFLSCEYQEEYYIDEPLLPYWHQFQIEAENLDIQLPKKSVMLIIETREELEKMFNGNGSPSGLCYGGKRTIRIYIASDRIKSNDYDLNVERIVFHELGHGMFDRKHNRLHYVKINGTQSFPVSVMTLTNYHYKQYREYYIKELFGFIDYETYAKEIGYEIVEY